MEWLFKKMLPYIDAQITTRIVQFHQALHERGQIRPIPPQYGVTADYMADQDRSSNQSLSLSEQAGHQEREERKHVSHLHA